MSTSTLSLIPIPAKVTSRAGAFRLTASTQIEASDALRAHAEVLRDQLRPATGFPLPILAKANGPRIALALDQALARLGDEGYRLTAGADAVAIAAARPAGLLHGTQTLRQLLPPAIFRRAVAGKVAWSVAGVEIEDTPRFSWRGSHLDVGRHFMPKTTVLKHIDLLAMHKLNVFHWHLTEDQGWRIEIKRYPKLTEVGAWRKESVAAQSRMKELGLRDEEELQSWFVTRIDGWLAKRGRRLIGWDEILEGGLASGATVMSWRGEKGGIAAAKAGHDVVMAPEKPTYFDHDQSEDHVVPIRGMNTLADVYAYEPVPKELSAAEAKHVLGAQGQLWTEYMPDPQRMEYMAWPRLCALAEVLWSPPATRDAADFARRLDAHRERLRILDVNFYRARL